ncbi:hypothetical protein EYB34_11225 [Bordetella trematum]|nr:hypothetical protein EYB34_11225 [Bordetella trematum]
MGRSWVVLLVLAVVLGGMLVAWVAGSRDGLLQEIKLLEVMTASGTVGAVVVALWLSSVQDRKDRLKQAAVAELFRRMLVGNILAAWSDLQTLRMACARSDLDGLKTYLRGPRAGFSFDALDGHVEKATALDHPDLVVVAEIYSHLQVITHEGRVWRGLLAGQEDLDSLTRIVGAIEKLFSLFEATPWISASLPRRETGR